MMSTVFTAVVLFFFFNDPATTEIYTLSLHDALPISTRDGDRDSVSAAAAPHVPTAARGTPRAQCARHPGPRSEEHTSELQSRLHLVCRLLLEKKKNIHVLLILNIHMTSLPITALPCV